MAAGRNIDGGWPGVGTPLTIIGGGDAWKPQSLIVRVPVDWRPYPRDGIISRLPYDRYPNERPGRYPPEDGFPGERRYPPEGIIPRDPSDPYPEGIFPREPGEEIWPPRKPDPDRMYTRRT